MAPTYAAMESKARGENRKQLTDQKIRMRN